VCCVGIFLLILGIRARKKRGKSTGKSFVLIIVGIGLCLSTFILGYNSVSEHGLRVTSCRADDWDPSLPCETLYIWNIQEGFTGTRYWFWTPGSKAQVFHHLAKQADGASIIGNTLTLTWGTRLFSVLSLGKGHYVIAEADDDWDGWTSLPKRDYTPPPTPWATPGPGN
jgi:hypothetical protein